MIQDYGQRIYWTIPFPVEKLIKILKRQLDWEEVAYHPQDEPKPKKDIFFITGLLKIIEGSSYSFDEEKWLWQTRQKEKQNRIRELTKWIMVLDAMPSVTYNDMLGDIPTEVNLNVLDIDYFHLSKDDIDDRYML